MNTDKKIKEIVLKNKRKIGKDAIRKLNSILEGEMDKLIKKATQQADFSGRKIIKVEDIC